MRSKFRTEKAKRRRRQAIANDTSIVATGLIMVVLCTFAALNSEYLTVTTVTVSGAEAAEADAIVKKAQQTLEGSFFFIIPRASAVFFPKSHLRAAVQEAMPRLGTVEIHRTGLRSVELSVNNRTPAALWCGDVMPDIAELAGTSGDSFNTRCYFIDEHGYVFEHAFGVTGTVYPRFWGAIDRGNPEGSVFVSTDEFARLLSLMHEISTDGEMPLGLLLVDEEEMELYLSGGTKILLLRSGDLMATIERITALQNSGIVGEGEPVEYIDLRFGDRVYLKRHGASAEAQ